MKIYQYEDDDDRNDDEDGDLHVTVLLLEHGALPLGRQQEGRSPATARLIIIIMMLIIIIVARIMMVIMMARMRMTKTILMKVETESSENS